MTVQRAEVNSRMLEGAFLVVIMLAVLLGGAAFLGHVAQFHGLAISMLGALAICLTYAFRRNYLAGGPQVRLQATRDAAFLAAIAAAIAFVAAPAHWSLGAAVVACELGLTVELFTRFTPAPP